jgi:hypothetical protein
MFSQRTYSLLLAGMIGCMVFRSDAMLYIALTTVSMSGIYDVIRR